LFTGAAGSNGSPHATSSIGGSKGGKGSPTGGVNPDGSPASPTGHSSAGNLSGNNHIATGGIVGIVIAILAVATIVFVYLIRRRSRARRSQSTNWWSFRATGTIRDDDDSIQQQSGILGGRRSPEEQAKVSSFRSSFGNSLSSFNEHRRSQMSTGVAPSLPPMIEVRSPSLGSAGGLLQVRPEPSPPLTPMSVRPFSPTESFAFPKPPNSERSNEANSNSRTITPKTTTTVQTTFAENYPPTPITSSHMPNPFNDPVPVVAATIPESAESSSDDHANFGPLETVRRPFLPTLDDELPVSPGDTVRVIKSFDDGWCFCELVKGDHEGSKGLIPIDCLRENGEKLPSFLAAKRVSSNYGVWEPVGISTQMGRNAF